MKPCEWFHTKFSFTKPSQWLEGSVNEVILQ